MWILPVASVAVCAQIPSEPDKAHVCCFTALLTSLKIHLENKGFKNTPTQKKKMKTRTMNCENPVQL